MRKRIQKLFAAALIVLCGVLLLSPATGWLVRLQIVNIGCCHAPDGSRQEISRQFENDFQVQLVEAIRSPDDRYPAYASSDALDPRVAALHDLALRYPAQPALYAMAIRYALDGSVQCDRMADEKPLAHTAADAATYANTPGSQTPPARLSAFLADCAAGERLDPRNAYFPIYRAYGLFAAYRDRAAIGELIAASNKPVYRDYSSDEALGRLKLADARNGGKEALSDFGICDSVLFPELSKVRDLARLSIAMAITDERAGREDQGFAIRRAVRRIGGMMRTDSTSAIGSLVGIAITAIAAGKPGGWDVPGYESIPVEQREAARANAYVAYLNHTGHHDEAIAYETERADGRTVRSLISLSLMGRPLTDALRLSYLWIVDLTLLLCIGTVLGSAVLALALGRVPAIRQATGMAQGARWGFGIGILTAAAAGAAWVVQTVKAAGTDDQMSFFTNIMSPETTSQRTEPAHAPAYTLIFALEAVIGVLALTAFTSKASGSSRTSALLRWPAILTTFACTLVCVSTASGIAHLCAILLVGLPFASVAAVAVIYRRSLGATLPFAAGVFLTLVAASLVGVIVLRATGPIASIVAATRMYNEAASFDTAMAPITMIAQVVVAGIALLVPVLISICAAIFVRRGRPGSVAAVGALRSAALPAACLLLLGYAVMLVPTIRSEKIALADIDAQLAHEGRHLAALAHVPWPGRVE